MTPERWARIQDLFDRAVALPAGERTAFVAREAGGDHELASLVAAMIEADASDRQELEQAVGNAIRSVAAAAAKPVDQFLGAYRIIREIGHGGMGAVYLAERADGAFTQSVAIKVVRGLLDEERVRRFRAERQFLASLTHPNIARLVDGGTTADGWPYLVMEFVDGVPIDRYCHDRELPIQDRLRLFNTVCDAVSHAHRHLIVHRDLKPSNILVTAEGVPKLLDFGIAKLLDTDDPDATPPRAHRAAGTPELAGTTMTGMRVLTPDYAAPEQVRGEAVTTATDVYTLGTLLFELVTGRRPHTFKTLTAQEIERVVCETDAPRPSTIARGLDDDLDVIILNALHKDPSRRYPTVDALADDLRRYLDGLPVLARASTWRYLTKRFVSRHRWGVAAAAAFVLLLTGFAVVVSVQAARIARERDTAQQERQTAEQVSDFLVGLFEVSDPSESRGNSVTARELLDRGGDRIEHDLAAQPTVQARMMDTIGRVYESLGLFDRSGAILEKSLLIRDREFGRRTAETAGTLLQLGEIARWKGDYKKAEQIHRETLEIRRELFGASHPSVAQSLNNVGLAINSQGRYDEGIPLLTQAIDIYRTTLPPGDPQIAVTLNNLGQAYRQRSRFAEAVPPLTEALEIRRKAFDGAHPLTANSLMQLGQVKGLMGEVEAAEALMRESLAMRLKVLGPDHPAVAVSYNNLASLLHDKADYAGAEPMYREAMALSAKRLGPDHPETAVTMNNLASLLEEKGASAEAILMYREALRIRRKALGDANPAVARGMHNLARALINEGNVAEGVPMVEAALALRRKLLGEKNLEYLLSLGVLAQARAKQKRFAEAESLFRDSLAGLRQALPEGHLTIGNTLHALGQTLVTMNKPAQAEPFLREALAIRTKRLPPGNPQIAATQRLLGEIGASVP